MLQLKIGIQLASLRLPFKKALHTAARLGAQAVEIDARHEVQPQELSETGLRQLRKMLDDLNLRVSAVSFRTRRGYDVEENLEARVEATKRAMQFAFSVGARVVVNHVGHIPEQLEGRGWAVMQPALADLGRFGQHVGASLAARTGGEEPARLAAVIAALPPGALGVDLDPGSLAIRGYSASDAARMLGQHVLHVHAKDGVRDLAQGRGLEVPLGRGSVDFPELLGILEENDYRGYLTIERERAEDPVAEVAQAIAFLGNI